MMTSVLTYLPPGRWVRAGWGLVVGVALFLGCSTSEAPTVGETVEVTPRPTVDLSSSGLPQLSNGHTELLEVPGGRLEYDPTLRDPITALAACVDVVIGCVDPDTRSLDDCFRSAPRCSTQTPWTEATPCCPSACFDLYASTRSAGAEPFPAFEQTLFIDRACMPGLSEQLAVGR